MGVSLSVGSGSSGADIESSDWRLRVLGLLSVVGFDSPPQKVQRCLSLAFDDPEPRVRGMAWGMISHIIRHATAHPLTEMIAAELTPRLEFSTTTDADAA